MFQKFSGMEKNLWIRDWGFHVFRSNIFCLSAKKKSWINPSMFQKIWVSKSFMHKKGISLFSVEIFLSHRVEKFRGGTIQCFRKLRVSKNFLHKKGISLLPVEIFFCFTVPKKFVREPFCDSNNFRYQKFSCIGEGEGASRHCRKKFCLTGPKRETW